MTWPSWLRAVAANLLATSILVPGAAGFLAVAFYLASDKQGPGIEWFFNKSATRAYLWASIFAVLAWLVFAALTHHRSYARRASAFEYDDLRSRYAALRARLTGLGSCLHPDDACDYGPALGEVEAHLDYADPLFSGHDPAGLRWVAGSGYLDLRERLHRAEEALLELETRAALIASADYDEQRIDGSGMANSRQLLQRLTTIRATLQDPSKAPSPPPGRAEIAAELREIRETVDEYRDGLRRALLQSRNQLFAAAVYASVNAYALLGVAMIAGAKQSQILAAAVYFLIGATVGLFKQLHSAWSVHAHRGAEDYGLDTVRLIQTPLFSGLAAVGGVVLTLMLLAATPSPSNTTSSTASSSSTAATTTTGTGATTTTTGAGATTTLSAAAAPTPAASPAARLGAAPTALPASTAAPALAAAPRVAAASEATSTTTSTSTGPQRSTSTGSPEATSDKIPSLSEIFDLGKNPITLVIAAVFGLTPALLISRLSAQAEQYKAQLKSSERTQGSASG